MENNVNNMENTVETPAEEVVTEAVVEETVSEETAAEVVPAEEITAEAPAAEETAAIAEPAAAVPAVVQPATPKKKMSKTTVALLIGAGAFILLAGFLGLGFYGIYSDLNTANSLYEQGKYMEAKEIYEDYTFVGWVSTMPSECDYQEGAKALKDGNYEEAREMFLYLGEYKDSADKADEAYFGIADELLEQGEYKEAAEIFAQLDSIEESFDKLDECNYAMADEYYKQGDLDAAAKLFGDMQGYKDSTNRFIDCMVDKGVLLYEAGEYEDAELLMDSYRIQSERARVYCDLCQFQMVRNTKNASDYDDAGIYDHLIQYKDSYPIVAEALKDPFFYFVRFWGAGWKYGSYSLDGNAKDNTIFYYVPWKSPNGNITYKCSDEGLVVYADEKVWFTITGFDSYDEKHPGKMYVTGTNGKSYTFKNYKSFE